MGVYFTFKCFGFHRAFGFVTYTNSFDARRVLENRPHFIDNLEVVVKWADIRRDVSNRNFMTGCIIIPSFVYSCKGNLMIRNFTLNIYVQILTKLTCTTTSPVMDQLLKW